LKKKRALLVYKIHVNERLFLHMPPPMPLVRYLFSKPVMVPVLILVGGYFADRYFSDEKAIKINYIDFVGTCNSTQGIWEGRYSVAVPASSNHRFSAISAVRDSRESLSVIDKRTKIMKPPPN
jgi:hypothetical protein